MAAGIMRSLMRQPWEECWRLYRKSCGLSSDWPGLTTTLGNLVGISQYPARVTGLTGSYFEPEIGMWEVRCSTQGMTPQSPAESCILGAFKGSVRRADVDGWVLLLLFQPYTDGGNRHYVDVRLPGI